MDDKALRLSGLSKRFGSHVAVDGIDLAVPRGEFVTLLGPSGSGKTTTLRMVAGFTQQDSGSVEIDGLDMSRVPPHKRGVGMVFQSYALFPHMTAADNIAFPLQMRRVQRREIGSRVDAAMRMVRLDGLGERYPRQLSGGQQQRVALARAIVFGPRVLLMDEPLGALDKKLREALQLEILRIAGELDATVLYVTHDQDEALTMSDRIAIFRDGRIVQMGVAEELYERPTSLFVADFMGESNILVGILRTGNGSSPVLECASYRWQVDNVEPSQLRALSDSPAALIVRPERLSIQSSAFATAGLNYVDATITGALYLGSSTKYQLELRTGQAATVRTSVNEVQTVRAIGEAVRLAWRPQDAVVVPAEGPGGVHARVRAGTPGEEVRVAGAPQRATETQNGKLVN